MLLVFYFSPTLWVFFFFSVSYSDTSAWRSHCYLLPISNKIFSKTLFFKNIFRFPAKSRRTEIFHILPASIQTSRTVHMPYQSGTFVSTDEPTRTHHSHPKSIVYIRAHSWRCIYSGFGYTWNDAYPLLFSLPPNPLWSIHPLLSPNPWQPLISCCLSNLAFSIISGSWNHVICSLFRLTSFT